jgi:hypothetical protein
MGSLGRIMPAGVRPHPEPALNADERDHPTLGGRKNIQKKLDR